MNLLLCNPFPRERVPAPKDETADSKNEVESRTAAAVATGLESPPGMQQYDNSENASPDSQNGLSKPNHSARSLLKSASISGSKCIGGKAIKDSEVTNIFLNISSCFSLCQFPCMEVGSPLISAAGSQL